MQISSQAQFKTKSHLGQPLFIVENPKTIPLTPTLIGKNLVTPHDIVSLVNVTPSCYKTLNVMHLGAILEHFITFEI